MSAAVLGFCNGVRSSGRSPRRETNPIFRCWLVSYRPLSILELVGGSSAFAGEFGSETFLQTTLATTGALPFLDPPLGPVLNATPSSPDYPAYQLASFCKPFGLQGRVRAALRAPRQDPGRGHGTDRERVPRGHAAADVLSRPACPREHPPLPRPLPRGTLTSDYLLRILQARRQVRRPQRDSVITLTIPLQLLDALEDRCAHRRYRCHTPRPLLELRDALGHEHRGALRDGAARGLGLH